MNDANKAAVVVAINLYKKTVNGKSQKYIKIKTDSDRCIDLSGDELGDRLVFLHIFINKIQFQF